MAGRPTLPPSAAIVEMGAKKRIICGGLAKKRKEWERAGARSDLHVRQEFVASIARTMAYALSLAFSSPLPHPSIHPSIRTHPPPVDSPRLDPLLGGRSLALYCSMPVYVVASPYGRPTVSYTPRDVSLNFHTLD